MDDILVVSRNFRGEVKRSWNCRLLEAGGGRLICEGTFAADVEHDGLGLIKKGTTSVEYYWDDRWYNVFEFREPDGDLRNLYCNLAFPPTVSAGVVDYLDLEIDVVVWPDATIEVLDIEDFERAAAENNFSSELRRRVDRALQELMNAISVREGPFAVLGPK